LTEIDHWTAAYDGTWRAYTKDPSINNTVNQSANMTYEHRGASFLAGASDNFLNTVDPASSELTARAKRWQNTFAGRVEYAPAGGDFFAGIDVNQTNNKYIADNPSLRQTLNRYDQQFGGRLGWLLQPETRLYTAYHREIIHHTVAQGAFDRDSKAHLLDFGVEGRIAPKITGQVQTGLQYANTTRPRSRATPPSPGTGCSPPT